MKILIFKEGALGDILMTTPLVEQIKQKYPRAQIHYWVGKSYSKILKNNPNINKIITFNPNIIYKKKIFKILKLSKKIRKENYDLGFILSKHWAFSILGLISKIKYRIGFKRKIGFNNKNIKYNNKEHEIIQYLKLINSKKITKPKIYFTKKEIEFGKKFKNKRYVVAINAGGLNPGESSAIRMLPKDLFKKIIQRIPKKYNLYFIGSTSEKSYYDQFKGTNLTGKSIHESAQILKCAKYVITTDCGPMHIAGAVNNNVIAIFGPTNPKRKAPFNAKTIWKDQDIYEPDYEYKGTIPKKQFFTKIKAKEIIKYIK